MSPVRFLLHPQGWLTLEGDGQRREIIFRVLCHACQRIKYEREEWLENIVVRNKIDDCKTETNTNEKQHFCAKGAFGTNRDKSKNRRELTAECGIQEIQVILSIITGDQQIVVITVTPTADDQLWGHMTDVEAVSKNSNCKW